MADFDRILNVGVKAGVAALKDEVGSQVRAANPGMFGMGEVQQEDDEYEGDPADGPDDEEERHWFNDGNKAENIACAVAAYRVLGSTDHCIAWHQTGMAVFCLSEELDEDIEDLADQQHLNPDQWSFVDNPAEIIDMDVDDAVMADLAEEQCDGPDAEIGEAKSHFEGFNWSHKSLRRSTVTIPGVQATLWELGDALQTDYRSDKDASNTATKTIDYTHQHGEDSGKLPKLYAISDNVLVIYGGNMKVLPSGIND
jgi:hypothetical protein